MGSSSAKKGRANVNGAAGFQASIATLLGIVALLHPGISVGEEHVIEEPTVLVDFTGEEEQGQWRIVNDGVMGGLSQSGIAIGPDHVAVFEGRLSLENNGGFASVRRRPHDYSLAGFDAVMLRIRGDGRTYQFRVRTNERFDGVSYRAEFMAEPGKWMTVTIPFSSLEPTFRGRPVPEAPKLKPEDIRQIGFLLARLSYPIGRFG